MLWYFSFQALPIVKNLSAVMLRSAALCCLMLCVLSGIRSQAVTNAGTDFWFAFTEVFDNTSAIFQVNISSTNATSGTVSIPGTGFSQNFTVVPGAVTSVALPSVDASISGSEVLLDRGVHVVTDDEVVVYTNTYHQFRSEASLVLPTPALGNAYYAMTHSSETKNGTLWESEFLVVAAGEEVEVEITPSANTAGGNTAGNPFTVTLDVGEIYQVQAASDADDLTGSHIRSTNPDIKFAVFSGNVWSTIFCAPNSDPIYEAQFPVSTWGKEYILVPTPLINLDLFRVMAAEDNTDVLVDGTLVATLNTGQFYEDTLKSAKLITATKPVCVGFFLVTAQTGCTDWLDSDPSMIMTNPNEQMFLDSITFFAVDEYNIDENYVNIVTRTNDTATLVLDGSTLSGFSVLAQDPTYSYISESIDTGSHSLYTSGCGFLAYSIGFGYAESYAYAAGVLLTNLAEGITYTNVSFNSDTICQGDFLQFNSSTTGNPVSWDWQFGDNTSSSASSPVHAYDSAGTYEVSLIIEYQCRIDTVYDTLTVVELPEINFGLDSMFICLSDSILLSADTLVESYEWGGGQTTSSITVGTSGWYYVTVSNGRCFDNDSIYVAFDPTINSMYFESLDTADTVCDGEELKFVGTTSGEVLYWDFGDGATDTGQSTIHAYAQGGNYTVELTTAYLCGLDTIVDVFDGTVRILETPDISLGGDTFICTSSFRLRVHENSYGYDLLWYPGGETDTAITITEAGTYALWANNGGCTDTDTLEVAFSTDFLIPNVITPNGDGVNDFWRIFTTPDCHDFNDLKIYNRWGELVFSTPVPISVAWDGRTAFGAPVEPGVYYYVLDGADGRFSGSLTVLLK